MTPTRTLTKVASKNKKALNLKFHPVVINMLDKHIYEEKVKGLFISRTAFIEDLIYEKLKEVENAKY